MPRKTKVILRPDQMSMIEQQLNVIEASVMHLYTTLVTAYGFSDQQVKALARAAEGLEEWYEKLVERQSKVPKEEKPPKAEKPPKEEEPEEEPPAEVPDGVVIEVAE